MLKEKPKKRIKLEPGTARSDMSESNRKRKSVESPQKSKKVRRRHKIIFESLIYDIENSVFKKTRETPGDYRFAKQQRRWR